MLGAASPSAPWPSERSQNSFWIAMSDLNRIIRTGENPVPSIHDGWPA